MIFIICQRIRTPLIAGMTKRNPYPICSFDLGYLLVCLGAVHLLCQTILASSGPPPTPLSYCVIVWLTPPYPPMYDAINEYVFSLSEYFLDIILNG